MLSSGEIENAVTCLMPEHAVGIRAARTIPSDAFAQPRCQHHAISGIAQGEWEYRTIALDDAVPAGWRVVWTGDHKLIKLTHWERVTP